MIYYWGTKCCDIALVIWKSVPVKPVALTHHSCELTVYCAFHSVTHKGDGDEQSKHFLCGAEGTCRTQWATDPTFYQSNRAQTKTQTQGTSRTEITTQKRRKHRFMMNVFGTERPQKICLELYQDLAFASRRHKQLQEKIDFYCVNNNDNIILK